MKQYKTPHGREVDYGQVMRDNLSQVWRHKSLWFLGLFSGTASALGGWSCDYNEYVTVPGQDEDATARGAAESITGWMQDHLSLVVTVALLAVLLGVLLWLWSVFCHGAVIASARDAHRGEPAGFRRAIDHGKRNFRPLLPYSLLVTAIPLVALFALAAAAASIFFLLASGNAALITAGGLLSGAIGLATISTVLSTLGLLGFFFLVPVAAVAAFILFNLGSRAVVLEGMRPIAALRDAASLLFDNLTSAAMLFIISVGISIGTTIVMMFAVLMAAIPALLAWGWAYSSGWTLPSLLAAGLLSLPPLLVGLVFVAGLNTYFTFYWTDARMIFSGEKKQKVPARPGPGKLLRRTG